MTTANGGARERAPKSFLLSVELGDYLVAHGTPPDAIQEGLIAETAALGPIAGMQVAPEQGAFLTILTQALGVHDAIEVGTFTGYSALCIARGLPADGRVLCCDVNEEWTAIARRYWQKAGVAERIELRLGPALDTLRALPAGTQFDLGFIDADKPNYRNYYEEILARLRPNGLILFDNVLWMGQVLDTATSDESTRAIQALNDYLPTDRRVETVMLSISDGLTIVRKRTAG